MGQRFSPLNRGVCDAGVDHVHIPSVLSMYHNLTNIGFTPKTGNSEMEQSRAVTLSLGKPSEQSCYPTGNRSRAVAASLVGLRKLFLEQSYKLLCLQ